MGVKGIVAGVGSATTDPMASVVFDLARTLFRWVCVVEDGLPVALSVYLPSSFAPRLSTYALKLSLVTVVLTEPEMGPS